MNMTLGYALLRDRRVIRTKLICPMKGNGKDALTRSCSNSIATMVAALAMAAGDLALDGAEAIIGPVVIATLLLPSDLVRQIRIESERMAHS